ncbi:bile acid:sodium symporter family protein [Flammeovirga yaeyamensis]|nr:bile acid:sodium symporter family protein [Flammeovirga yaeyamensis]MBB3697388.1 BASS family bile acid:Na+ symporter [Flammeovirga yaeyamensis]
MNKYFTATSILSIAGAILLYSFTEFIDQAALLLIGGIAIMAVGTKQSKRFGGFSFSFWILSGVIASLAYPQYFTNIGEFNTKRLIVPLIQIIMFGMGSQMSLKDFSGVLKMPKGVIIGVVCQFTIMPIVGFSLAYLFQFPSEVAAGIILIGSSPSGLASNVMAFISKANLALSVTLTAFATLLSPIMTPLMMKIFASEMVVIDFVNMMADIFNMVILPICAGLIFNLIAFDHKDFKSKIYQLIAYIGIVLLKVFLNTFHSDHQLHDFLYGTLLDTLIFVIAPILLALVFVRIWGERKDIINNALTNVSLIGIAVIIIVIIAAGREHLMNVGFFLILACFLHNTLGYVLGYSMSKLLRLNEKDCRTIAFEVGMQNGGLASGLAHQMGKLATLGLAPAVFGSIMNITGSTLASWWKSR